MLLWFLEISSRRRWSEHGPQPIAYSEIEAWQRAHRVELAPHELDWLLALDRCYLTKDSEAKP